MIAQLLTIIERVGFRDLVEITIIAILIYQFFLLMRGTRGWQMTLGLTALVVFYYLTRVFELRTVEWVFANFFTYFVFALIVIFQSEIRRGLAKLGRGHFWGGRLGRSDWDTLDEIVHSSTNLSAKRIGALIVIEREIGLRNYVESGIKLDAFLTYDLLVTIFHPGSALHDGSVIIQGDRVSAAACFLPLTLDPSLSRELGTRHRAAIGITEETDAIAVVVSEETGTISAVHDRRITRNLDGPGLLKYLQDAIAAPKSSSQKGDARTRQVSSEEQRREAV
jgi:diadenylate cyclase